MIKVLLDQGLAPVCAELLRAAGWSAIHVSEIGMERSDDPAIMEYARQNGLTCITLDHDFHSHLALTSAGSPSVVFLRLEGMNAAQQATLIQQIWKSCRPAIEDGAAISADGQTIRIKRLPLK